MTTMLETFKNIKGLNENGRHAVNNEEFVLIEDCANTYHVEQLAVVPAGTKIIADFAGDFGIYAVAEVDGVIRKIKIEAHELHKIDFGRFDARKL